MKSDRTLALGAAVIAALSLAPAAAEEPKEIFTWGADARLREEVITNVGLDDNVTIQPGGNFPFRMTVSSLGGRLARVEFAVEARP